jgi:hypothetical protein
MNKNDETLKRRRDDLIAAISVSNKKVGDVIEQFASDHYLSAATVWKDYERGLDDLKTMSPNKRGSKRY